MTIEFRGLDKLGKLFFVEHSPRQKRIVFNSCGWWRYFANPDRYRDSTPTMAFYFGEAATRAKHLPGAEIFFSNNLRQ